ncbi:MAG: protein translocase subunit SecF [Acidimicrobiales bacterium]
MSTVPLELRRHNIWQRLYYGETSYDFIGRRRIWFIGSGLVILLGLVFLITSGLNLSIEFRGGTSWEVPSKTLTVAQARSAVVSAGLGNSATVQQLRGQNGTKEIFVEAYVKGSHGGVNTALETKVTDALAKAAGTSANNVSITAVGPSWGSDVTNKAILALALFILAIILYLSVQFEPKMALAAIVAVFHDILVTVGVYAIFHFSVSQETVIAFLTILGYSLYDTVVVFDRVQEAVRSFGGSGRYTYSDTVNLSMNQVLMRSINTSLVAIMPIVSVLVIGAYLLGAASLQDFGLALFVGLLSGAYSSIFIASPLLAVLKEREPRYSAIRNRLASRSAGASTLLTPASAAAGAGAGGSGRDRGPAVLTPSAPDADGSFQDASGGLIAPGGGPRPGGARPGSPSGARRTPPRPRKKGRRR